MKRVLDTSEIVIDSGQYIPFHPKCSHLHGHSYFIRNLLLSVKSGAFVDFGKIKEKVKEYDHKLFCPPEHVEVWEEVGKIVQKIGVIIDLKVIDGPNKMNLVEEIGEQLAEELLEMDENVEAVSFGIYEGPNQGTIISAHKNELGEVVFA